ncbi:MAG: HDOD domain-containing protein [Nitrospirota bacterium]
MQQESRQSTIKDVILARLQQHSDFPAMSSTISLLNQFRSSEETSVSEFANVILRDYALTSKILKIVNSVNYSQFGEVTTISRAIILLGFENIKNLALTLMLFDHMQKNSAHTEHLNSMVQSLYSAVLGQKIAYGINFPDKEEAFICALFHTFGRIMVAFALPRKMEEIKEMSRERRCTGDAAALALLGARFEDIGMAIAREWHFPHKIVYSMHRMRGQEILPNPSDLDKLNSIATLANELAAILATSADRTDADRKIDELLKTFRNHFGEMKDKVMSWLGASIQDMTEFSAIFDLGMKDIAFNRQLVKWSDTTAPSDARIVTEPPRDDFISDSLKTIDVIFESERADTPESIFTKGIQDINNSILSNFSLNDIIRIVLETMYRGMQLSGRSKALFLIKDPHASLMQIRFGFGSDIEELKKWLKITYGDAGDIFTMAIVKQNDLVVKDMDAPDIRKLLPAWYRSRAADGIFLVLLPIIINSKPIGMFYVEGEREGFQRISGGHLSYLKILRDQTVMAIRQKQGY